MMETVVKGTNFLVVMEFDHHLPVTQLYPSLNSNKVEQWYVRHNLFIVLNHRLHVSTYIQVIFRPSYTGESLK